MEQSDSKNTMTNLSESDHCATNALDVNDAPNDNTKHSSLAGDFDHGDVQSPPNMTLFERTRSYSERIDPPTAHRRRGRIPPARRLSDSRVSDILKGTDDGLLQFEQLKQLHVVRHQLLSQHISDTASQRPRTWIKALGDVDACISTILRDPLILHHKHQTTIPNDDPNLRTGLCREHSARRYDEDVNVHDDVHYRISRHLREPIAASDEEKGQTGKPVRVETALDAYSRGEFSTGQQPDRAHLPPGLKSLSSLLKRPSHNDLSLRYHHWEDDRDSYRAKSLKTRSLAVRRKSTFQPLFAGDQSHIHPALRTPRLRYHFPTSSDDDNETDDDDEAMSSAQTPRTSSTLTPSRGNSETRPTPHPDHLHHSPSGTFTSNPTTPTKSSSAMLRSPPCTPPKTPPRLRTRKQIKHPHSRHQLTPPTPPPSRPPPLLPLEAAKSQDHQSRLLDALLGVPKGAPTRLALLLDGETVGHGGGGGGGDGRSRTGNSGSIIRNGHGRRSGGGGGRSSRNSNGRMSVGGGGKSSSQTDERDVVMMMMTMTTSMAKEEEEEMATGRKRKRAGEALGERVRGRLRKLFLDGGGL